MKTDFLSIAFSRNTLRNVLYKLLSIRGVSYLNTNIVSVVRDNVKIIFLQTIWSKEWIANDFVSQ